VQEFIAIVGEVDIGMTLSALKQTLIYMKTKTLQLFMQLEMMEAMTILSPGLSKNALAVGCTVGVIKYIFIK
jgi:hypothetical protein